MKEIIFSPKKQSFTFICLLDGDTSLSVSLVLVASLLLFRQYLRLKVRNRWSFFLSLSVIRVGVVEKVLWTLIKG